LKTVPDKILSLSLAIMIFQNPVENSITLMLFTQILNSPIIPISVFMNNLGNSFANAAEISAQIKPLAVT
jgi:hypothetical protein